MSGAQKGRLIAASTIMLLFLGVLYAWSMFRVELQEIFPSFTAAQLSLNFTIVSIGFCLGGFFGGKISSRWDQRLAARISACLILLGFLGCSLMEYLSGYLSVESALLLMYVCYGGLAGLGVGIGYNACISGTSPRFPKSLGLVSGVLLMGFGFGSLLLGLLIQALSDIIGVFAVMRVFALAIFAVIFAGSFFLKKPEAAQGTAPAEGATPGQMLSRGSFWIYFLWNTISASAGLLVINSSANIAIAFGTAAGLGMIVSVFNGAGRPVTGAIMDKMGQFGGMLIMNGVMILGGLLLVLAAGSGAAWAVLVGMVLVGICYGGGVTISAKVIRELYGPRHYAVNFSLSNFCMIPAAFIGPYISGLLQDRSGGGYDSTFLMVLVMALIALAAIFVLRWAIRRETAKSEMKGENK